ncbi:MAG: archease [Candidatus Diapherotrites archaeon CG10_big_fil_rev_8_21_14_0_10_31_34]|nr:MAG: archease [Candidatus Diapherotrites archaeon CG10_big_fil_rev_8_21_14_0_10_31_34]PJA21199.1 MAG: archease [Candidatus Diapherotrites archaeon CG_4_10_14_0_2_um_filter_31_5]
MQYEYLEHTADVKFRAFGKTKKELIENSGKALCNAIIDLKTIEKKGKAVIEIKAENFEELLFEFLKEVLFEIDSQEIIFSGFKVKELIEGKKSEKEIEFKLRVSCFGEKIDLKKHEIKTEVKAITKHEFKVEKKKDWTATVLVDV